ncbi:unnamed protein product, partial [Allacma fusca]
MHIRMAFPLLPGLQRHPQYIVLQGVV